MTEILQAPHTVAFSYRRSVGGAQQRYLAGLAGKEIWGSRRTDGRVAVPPVDWDPTTGEAVDGFVRVADRGVVTTWTWVPEPGPDHPLDHPFAFALINLDGADTAILHVVDTGVEERMVTGMAVRADWRTERTGSVLDIRAFTPAGDPPDGSSGPVPAGATPPAEVRSDVSLRYTYQPGEVLSGFLRALAERRIVGGRCQTCQAVYVPPHARCPVCRCGPMSPVQLVDRGTVVSYTVVHLPFHGMTLDLPFVCAWIRLDGADVPFAHLLGEVSPEEVDVGRHVRAVWAPEDELTASWESIRYFRPVDEPGPPGGRGARWDP